MIPKLKICGMKHNVSEVAVLQPDYLGFIFYEHSARNFTTAIPAFSESIKTVGVFVDASIETVSATAAKHKLDVIQLHGDESPDFCHKLQLHLALKPLEIWKAFPVGDCFDFNRLEPYETHIDKFLFDAKGPNKGGNGFRFNWQLLASYTSTKPFILSGGIGNENIIELKEIFKTNLPLFAIDINSKFEHSPGLKDISALKKFINELSR